MIALIQLLNGRMKVLLFYEIKILEMDGYDEHIVHGDRLRRWISTIGELNDRSYNLYNSRQNKPRVTISICTLFSASAIVLGLG